MDATIVFLEFARSLSYEILAGCLFLFVVACVYSARQKTRAYSSPDNQATSQRHHISIHKTQIIRCTISHFRLFPKKHRFVYPYLSVGIPVRSPTSNWLLSVDVTQSWKRGWLHVSAKDYLDRGRNGETLSENIDHYLKLQGLDPEAFPHVYLLTSARFLNYVFNPASFWYLYASDYQLKYVIAEVNNTFDERRMYLFPVSGSPGMFKANYALNKDFHVSPFNSRKGSYVLSTVNPAEGEGVSVTTTLRSSKGYHKLIARWWSNAPAIDSSELSPLQALWLLVRWGLTVLVTFARISFQAILLAHGHKLKIWYRPEPRESAIARRPTAAEVFLASIFVQYLQYLGDIAPNKFCLLPPRSGISLEGSYSHSYSLLELRILREASPVGLNLRIHTPQFYREVITYDKLTNFLSYTLLNSYEENRTAWSDNAQSLVATIEDLELTMNKDTPRRRPHILSDVPWAIFRRLRYVQPLKGAYPDPGLPTARTHANPRDQSRTLWAQGDQCFLDDFVLNNCGLLIQLQYMLATLGLQWRAWVIGAVGGE